MSATLLNPVDMWAAYMEQFTTSALVPSWVLTVTCTNGSQAYTVYGVARAWSGSAAYLGSDSYGIGYFHLISGQGDAYYFAPATSCQTVIVSCGPTVTHSLPVLGTIVETQTTITVTDTSTSLNPGGVNPWFTHSGYPVCCAIETDLGWHGMGVNSAASASLADAIAAFNFGTTNNIMIVDNLAIVFSH